MHLGTLGSATCLALWGCMAPILVLCICDQGHARSAIQGHADGQCGHHDGDHGADPERSPDHDHEDSPLGADGVTVDASGPRTLSPLAFVAFTVSSVNETSRSHAGLSLGRRDGPPGDHRLALTSTVLRL
ncbi:MAG: hypothetical protein CMJ18_16415 [Phycisphaeraceae bacterium]|nr:hypothetical protein [Phycisphaeraceae bacterium]